MVDVVAPAEATGRIAVGSPRTGKSLLQQPIARVVGEASALGLIENHLAPFFGSKDLREIRETDLLSFARTKLEAGLAPKTIQNALSEGALPS